LVETKVLCCLLGTKGGANRERWCQGGEVGLTSEAMRKKRTPWGGGGRAATNRVPQRKVRGGVKSHSRGRRQHVQGGGTVPEDSSVNRGSWRKKKKRGKRKTGKSPVKKGLTQNPHIGNLVGPHSSSFPR